MLVIRLQRTGRKGHAMFRIVVQDSRRTPSSGKVVAWLGSYDPHAKTFSVDKEKVAFYMEHGAQPSPRIAALLKADGVKLPDWVSLKSSKSKAVRNPDKRRATQPAPAEEEATSEASPSVETAAPEDTAEPEVATVTANPDTEQETESQSDN
ncbi:MAG TPA: 30S ribosomal protein S16 [Candidatus Saccharimonadales bacterium]|nr:30S ribosomal protein S16 [Candidatus Saccharimonadales bacterium]